MQMPAPTFEDYRRVAPSPMRREGGRRCARTELAPMPLISVVTVARNAEKTIERAITSVLEQTGADFEYIVIDGSSTDSTLEIVKRYDDKIEYWLSEPDAGIFDAMNKGIALARGRFIAILNSDDHYLPGAFKLVAEKSQSIFGGIIYGDYIFTAADAEVKFPVQTSLNLSRGMTLGHPAMFVSYATYQNIGLYDPALRFAGDLDFSLRAKEREIVFNRIDQPLAVFESGGTAERHLLSACIEAASVIRHHVGRIRALPFVLLSAQRVAWRTPLRIVKTLFGEKAYRTLKRRYYLRKAGAALVQ
jgi:glycosyltransferase involved in cell wall biosynthesis